MRELFGVFFVGLLVAVHSAPSSTQTPSDAKEVLQEFMADGLLVDSSVLPKSTTEPPKRNVTAAAEPTSFDGLEGSGDSTTAPTSTHTSQLNPSEMSEGSGEIPFQVFLTSTTTAASKLEGSSRNLFFETSAEGSGTEPITTTAMSVSAAATELQSLTSNPSRTPTTGHLFPQPMSESSGNKQRLIFPFKNVPRSPTPPEIGAIKGHTTPDWIIIVGFMVGLAALIALCAAIATRDKWNGPKHIIDHKINASNQEMEQEMKTFLPKEEPKENGKEEEYTVIPLEDLPEIYSSKSG